MSDDPRDDIATRMARDAQRLDEERRRGPLIDFGGLQLGGKSAIFGIGFGWPEFLGILAFGYGVVFGRADESLLAGVFYALLVWLPFRLLLSGSQFLFGLFSSKSADRASGAQIRLPAIIAWPILGAGVGAILGALIASALGDDIAPMEGVVRFAPIGLVIGLIVGVFRRKRR
jgi:hypothetical protein